jgi:rfaE bifunctional protein nucleotidyltransferase chain/domain
MSAKGRPERELLPTGGRARSAGGAPPSASDAIPAPRYPGKIATYADARARARSLPRPLVFTNGVFDVLHRGHVTYLDQARSLGASLVVAVNSDESVRRLGKGHDRPLNPLEDRMSVLAALASVDLVVPFDTDTPRDLIVACLPDVLVKGGDYTETTTAGAAEVIAAGGKFVAIPFASSHSTTALVDKIRR